MICSAACLAQKQVIWLSTFVTDEVVRLSGLYVSNALAGLKFILKKYDACNGTH